MDLSLRQLRAFLAVAEQRSFSAAAVELRTAQSNLSRIVAEIETTTGCALFNRTTRNVTLTDEGAALVEPARSIVSTHAREMDRFSEVIRGSSGVARIAALPSVSFAVLPAYYERMLAEHPGIQIELREGASDDILDLLHRDEVHVGVGLEPRDAARIDNEAFISDHFVAIVGELSPLASRDSVTWRELCSETFIALSSQTSVRQLTDVTFRRIGESPRSVIHVPNTASVAGLVARGIGVSALPALALGLFDYPGLVRLPLRKPRVTRQLHLLWSHDLPKTQIGERALGLFRTLRKEQVSLPFGAAWAGNE